ASLPSFTGIFGDGMWKQCIVMSMPDRAAREPPMYTFDEPVMISYMADRGGTMPQQVGLRPKSPQRAAGLLLISTRKHVPRRIGPSGGKGIGGTGGGPLGGCLTWAWGMPRASPVSVAAGNGPIALARPLTSLFIFSSAAAPRALAMAAPGSVITPSTD